MGAAQVDRDPDDASAGGPVRGGDSSDGARVPVGISSCLLGERVRYNGEHRKAALLIAELTPHVRWVPVCPEVEAGMGVPREPVHLVEARAGEPLPATGEETGGVAPCRLVGVESGRDWTEPMETFAAICTASLEELRVSGYIFKSRSPSCGLKDVPVHAPDGVPEREGPGLFAAALRARFPHLPVAEEADLGDIAACREFLERVRGYEHGRRPG